MGEKNDKMRFKCKKLFGIASPDVLLLREKRLDIFPQPGHPQVTELYRAINRRFPGKVRIMHNYKPYMLMLNENEKHVRTRGWRRGAFEVTAMNDDYKLLYSKLDTGVNIFDVDKYRPDLERWLDKLDEKYELTKKPVPAR